jgi:hypothetical protein
MAVGLFGHERPQAPPRPPDETLRPRRAITPGKLNLISRTYLIDGMPVISHISGAAKGLLDAKRS